MINKEKGTLYGAVIGHLLKYSISLTIMLLK